MIVQMVITDISFFGLRNNLLLTVARCLVIIISRQCNMVDFT